MIDDIFGELDPVRRNQLLRALPADAQKLVTATNMAWQEERLEGPIFTLANGELVAGESRS